MNICRVSYSVRNLLEYCTLASFKVCLNQELLLYFLLFANRYARYYICYFIWGFWVSECKWSDLASFLNLLSSFATAFTYLFTSGCAFAFSLLNSFNVIEAEEVVVHLFCLVPAEADLFLFVFLWRIPNSNLKTSNYTWILNKMQNFISNSTIIWPWLSLILSECRVINHVYRTNCHKCSRFLSEKQK